MDDNNLLLAIDNHNVANGDESWFSHKIDSISDFIGDVGKASTLGTAGAVVSGIDSILNSGIALANWVAGTDIKEIDTQEVLADLDSNLADYYSQNKQGVDTAGFVIGMFAPGTAGVKALRMAQAGKFGNNLGKAVGFFEANTKKFADLAKAEIAQGTPFSITNSNTLKALAFGAGSQAVDAAAFEIAVAASMFKSPTLDGQSVGDLTSNIITGTLLGGGIGGLLHGVGLVYGLRKAQTAVSKELFPYQHIQELGEGASSDLKILHYKSQQLLFPEVSDTVSETLKDLAVTTRQKSVDRLDNLMQQEFNKLAGDDVAVGMQFAKDFKQAQTIEDAASTLLNVKKLSRITEVHGQNLKDVTTFNKAITAEELTTAIENKDFTSLLRSGGIRTAGENTFTISGNASGLKVATNESYTSAQEAFSKGYDVWRGKNGTFSVNPESKILTRSAKGATRAFNDLIVDFESGGAIVDRATAGIADLATTAKPIEVRKNSVIFADNSPITFNRTQSNWTPLGQSHLEAQARYFWADNLKISNWKNEVLGAYDLPMLEKAYKEGAEGYKIKFPDGILREGYTSNNLRDFITTQKVRLAEELNGRPLDELGYRLNVTQDWLESGAADGWMKHATIDQMKVPRYGKMEFDKTTLASEALNSNMLDGAVNYEQRVAAIRQRHEANFNNYAGDRASLFPDAPNFHNPGSQPLGQDAGASLFGFANGAYGSIQAWAQFTGSNTAALRTIKKTEAAKALNRATAGIVDNQKLVDEYDLINNHLRSQPGAFILTNEGIVSKEFINKQEALRKKIQDAKTTNARENAQAQLDKLGTAKIIPVSPEVREVLATHAQLAGEIQLHKMNMQAAAGIGDTAYDTRTIYPIPINTRNYKNFVLVRERTMNMEGNLPSVVAAKDETQLRKMIDQIDQNEFQIITKQDSEEFHKALGDYDSKLGFNETLVDSMLRRKGVLSDFMPTTGTKRSIDDLLDWHMSQQDQLVRSMVNHRYSQSFEELKRLGETTTNVATSQFANITDYVRNTVKNPYTDIIKTTLDISKSSEHRWWTDFNSIVKNAIEIPVNTVRGLFQKTNKIGDAELAEINATGDKLGIGRVFENTFQANVAAGNIADKPWLAKVIAKGQGVMSGTLLQLDTFNAINNILGTPILLSAEMSSLRKAIVEKNPEMAGKLANLLSTNVPGIAEATLPSTMKLIKNAVENYRLDHAGDGSLLARYQSIGTVTDVLNQERFMLDNLTTNFGRVTENEAQSGVTKAIEFGKKWTGNKLAEEFTRFVSSDVMRQVTDLGIEAGILTTKEANEYISMFVNRTQGNYIHSQRPIVFQGVVGQAISLFQTYQFNLMQQLFRYVGEGDKKSVATLLGLQGSIYGLQGMPAFNFINTHIVGNAAGNTEHRDLYNASYTTFGKTLGDWMLYGTGSNALGVIDPGLRANIYSRGDINPRQVTVIPTSFVDIPLVNASVKFVSNLWNVGEKLKDGGAFWSTVSQGIEHNGLSRPLSGLAAIAQGYTTTTQGSLLSSSQDFLSVANASRIFGGKPFDEAIALDAMYRVNAYRAKNLSLIHDLGEAVRSTAINGGSPTPEQVSSFMTSYTKAGGKQEGFNKFLTGTMLSANKSQVNKLAENINSPFGKQLQIIMGGQELPDATNQINSATPAASIIK